MKYGGKFHPSGYEDFNLIVRVVFTIQGTPATIQCGIFRLSICHVRTKILPIVLHGYETWSVTLKEGYRLRVFDNRALRKTLELKRGEVTRGWRRLHSEELHDRYCRATSQAFQGHVSGY
jgi:hypothetical protein